MAVLIYTKVRKIVLDEDPEESRMWDIGARMLDTGRMIAKLECHYSETPEDEAAILPSDTVELHIDYEDGDDMYFRLYKVTDKGKLCEDTAVGFKQMMFWTIDRFPIGWFNYYALEEIPITK